MTNGAESADEKKAREELATALRTPIRPAAVVNKNDLCQKYRDLKPTIDAALKFIEKIPKWGPVIVKAIKTLEGIADAVCALP